MVKPLKRPLVEQTAGSLKRNMNEVLLDSNITPPSSIPSQAHKATELIDSIEEGNKIGYIYISY